MRTLALALLVMGFGWPSFGAGPSPLTSVRQIHALSVDEASHLLPVDFQGTVTFFSSYDKNLFVQDGDAAVYVRPSPGVDLKPGDRVRIKGATGRGFRPIVSASEIEVLGHGDLPKAVPATFDQLVSPEADCRLVSVRGRVLTADSTTIGGKPVVAIVLLTDGGPIDVHVFRDDPSALKDILDAEIEITGPAAGRFDGKLQKTGIMMDIASPAEVKILHRATTDAWSIPLIGMDEILTRYHVENQSRRVRVRGTITYYEPGATAVLQYGARSLWIDTQMVEPLRIGDRVEATGFPDARNGFLTLADGEISDRQEWQPVKPLSETGPQLAKSMHLFDLVSVEGEVITAVRSMWEDEYVLVSDGYMFSAVFRHPRVTGATVPPMKQVRVGSKVRITGICVLEDANPFDRNVAFNILLRSPDDVEIVANPSLLNVRNLVLAVSLLVLVVCAVGGWGWTLRKRVRQQTAALSKRIAAEAALERQMAQLEQRRSRILEDINGNEPLAGILEHITDLVSTHLDGAPCWCEVTDGARLGPYPERGSSLRIVSREIAGRSGAILGRLHAGIPVGSIARPQEDEALSVGAKLATLAIETRRLYSDLRHRSEFDLLTDIRNRFSLDKMLDEHIGRAREEARIFGLIYIDLDEFKQINDFYGHQVGDLYLQEAAGRMKRQLRANDTLARLGGDEFAALVPVVHSREEVEEIADRLGRCFAAPFLLDGNTLSGSASVGIALYPEDGATKDKLLSAADAAMYVAKHTRSGDARSRIQEALPRS